MLKFLFNKRVNKLNNVDLLDDKYYNIYIKAPLDINGVYKYINYLKDNNIKDVTGTPDKFRYYRVPYWISDSKGYVYDYMVMLNAIYEAIEIYKDGDSILLKRFFLRLEEGLKPLNLTFN